MTTSERKNQRGGTSVVLDNSVGGYTTSGGPEPKGRDAARWGLAGAMLAAIAVLGVLVVPTEDTNLDTTAGATNTTPLALADDGRAPLIDNASGGSVTTATSGSTVSTPGSPVATSAPTASSGPATSAPASTAMSSTTAKAAATPSTSKTSTTKTPTTQPATTAPTTAAPTTPPTSAVSGGCWNPVMQDDFNGSSLDTATWTIYESAGNSGHGLRRASAISVSGGSLNITAQMVDGTLVSGGLSHRYNQAYGRYEFRVRTDPDPSEATSGLVLTWPQSNVHPRDGENDIYETLGTPGDRSQFSTFIHKPFGSTSDQDYYTHPVSASDWRTVAMEWTPTQISIFRDGALVHTLDETSADLIPDVAHFVAIQLDAVKDTMSGVVTMQVDYIKVFSAC